MYDWTGTIEIMRRAALQKYQKPAELQIRKRFGSARALFFRTVIERIACETKVDLRPFYEDVRRHNEAQRLYVTQVMDKLEARATEQALEERKRFDVLREEYLRDFPKPYELPPGRAELKFNIPIQALGTALPAECNTVFGGGLGGPTNFGTYEASADMRVTLGQPGVQFFPRIYTDAGDCENTTVGQTFHEVFFRMAPLERSFVASSVRVDLFGVGIASSHDGDISGFDEFGLYATGVDLAVDIAHVVRDSAQYVRILDKNLFRLERETVQSIRILSSLDDNPTALVLRGTDFGGGEIGCYMILRAWAWVPGAEGGRTRLDFSAPNYGLALTGISLIGEYLPPPPP